MAAVQPRKVAKKVVCQAVYISAVAPGYLEQLSRKMHSGA